MKSCGVLTNDGRTGRLEMRCPGCDAYVDKMRSATVSPFVARRVWNREPHRATLLICGNCGLQSFNPGLDTGDLASLYRGYRSSEYQRERQRVEPWYTPMFNANLESESLILRRRSAVRNILNAHLDFRPRNILDYGGNRGELAAPIFPDSSTYVFDISGKQPLPNVTRLNDLDACRAIDFDLVVCSNVLEHVTRPMQMLQQILYAAPQATLFLEVPIEMPLSFGETFKRTVQQALLCARDPGLAASLFRLGFILQMHEHVSYYTEEALQCAAVRAGYRSLNRGAYFLRGAKLGIFHWPSRLAWIVAVPTNAVTD